MKPTRARSMQFASSKSVRSGRAAGVRAEAAGMGCLILMLLSADVIAWSAEPRVDHIERLGTNQVTIHFDTDANRTYILQYLDDWVAGTNGMPSGTWSNLAVIPATPFNNHYVLPDYATSSFPSYRLAGPTRLNG